MSNVPPEERRVVRVSQVKELARNIKGFELRAFRGRLAPFTAGAHITVHLENNKERQYSICSNPKDGSKYEIAVLKETNGRGGSRYLHEIVSAGSALLISGPLNHFELVPSASRYLLIAGGIGITPIIAMIRDLSARFAKFRLHYCARSAADAAFLDLLPEICHPGQLFLHFDGGNPKFGLDVAKLLEKPEPDTHVYCCGPLPLMRAVREAASAWPKESLHFESFKPAGEGKHDEDAFEIVLKRRGTRFAVPPSKSIVQVLRDNGCDVETSCEAGTCGTCKTRYVSGNPIHNDFVLSEQERREYVMVCCARAAGILELDL